MQATPTDNRYRPPPQILQDIHNAELVGLPRCCACLQLAFEARLTPHGCRLCGFCHSRLRCLDDGQPCPGAAKNLSCRLAGNFRGEDCRLDEDAALQLGSVFVYCWNQALGCPYSMPYMKLDTHEAQECQFKLVACSGCDRILIRRDLARHQLSDECRQKLIPNIGNFGVPQGDANH